MSGTANRTAEHTMRSQFFLNSERAPYEGAASLESRSHREADSGSRAKAAAGETVNRGFPGSARKQQDKHECDCSPCLCRVCPRLPIRRAVLMRGSNPETHTTLDTMKATIYDTTGADTEPLGSFTFDSASITGGEIVMTIADKAERQAALGVLLEHDCEPSKDGEQITVDWSANDWTLRITE